MTVAAESPTIAYVFTGPGEYTFNTFTVYSELDVKAYHRSTGGVETQLTYSTDYTVTLNENSIGGHVDVTIDTLTGGSLILSRELEFSQEVDLESAGRFDPETLERALDEIIMRLQQMNVRVDGVTTTFNWRSDWETGLSYVVRDLVEGPDDNWYYCAVAHSSGVFATDLASGFWALLINRADLVDLVSDAEDAQTAAEAAKTAAEEAQVAAEAAAENIVAAWEDSPTSYDFPDLVAGTNGYTYRCVGADVVGVDPITDDGTNWINISAGLSIVGAAPISTNSNALSGYLHILTASCVLTLPASPSTPSLIAVANLSGTTTCSIARNGHKINGIAEDMTLDILNASFQLYYTGTTYGWVIL
jgi:hypothetical protein